MTRSCVLIHLSAHAVLQSDEVVRTGPMENKWRTFVATTNGIHTCLKRSRVLWWRIVNACSVDVGSIEDCDRRFSAVGEIRGCKVYRKRTHKFEAPRAGLGHHDPYRLRR